MPRVEWETRGKWLRVHPLGERADSACTDTLLLEQMLIWPTVSPPPDSFCFPSRHCVCIHIDLPCSDNAIHASMSEDQVRELLEDLRVPADAVASADAMGSNAEPKPCPKSHYNHYLSIVHSLGALSFTMFDHRTHCDGINLISSCTCFRVYMQQNIISQKRLEYT